MQEKKDGMQDHQADQTLSPCTTSFPAHTHLQRHEGDQRSEAARGHEPHLLPLVAEPAQNWHDEEDAVTQCLETSRLQDALIKGWSQGKQ